MAEGNACTICKGTGYVREDVPFGHPDFGQPIECTCKKARKRERRRQQLLALSRLESMRAFRDARLATFNPRVPGVQEAFEAAASFAADPRGWLVLVGDHGCGKTHLAVAIAWACLEQGQVVLFTIVPDLLDHLRAAFNPDTAEVYDELFARMCEAEVLVLDDLGSQQNTEWAKEKLFQLLNYRYNAELPTVITANTLACESRIRSRLSDTYLVRQVYMDQASDYRRRRSEVAWHTHDSGQEPDGANAANLGRASCPADFV